MNAKTPFPFDPFVDSLLGEKILYVFESFHLSRKDLLDALLKQTNQTSFFFTPNATKQTLMVTFPAQIRNHIANNEYAKVGEILMGLANGSLSDNQVSALDVTLELLEWLLTGFEIDDEIVIIMNRLFACPRIINLAFVEMVRDEYVKELRE
jgi:hypothetical protein